jgi:hypothetical protein
MICASSTIGLEGCVQWRELPVFASDSLAKRSDAPVTAAAGMMPML